MNIELKPCPFCGNTQSILLNEKVMCRYFIGYSVYCCRCEVETRCFDTKEKAAEAWNRRDHDEKP